MTKRALVRKSIGRLQLAFGRFDSLKHLELLLIKRLVFVCRGNVCRSPYAEAAAKSLGFTSLSCGVEVSHSAPAEKMAIKAAYLRGKDLSQHMSRSIHNIELNNSDCLIAMDPTHLPVARDVAERVGCQITLIGLWRKIPIPEIADPYGKALQVFSVCFDEIDEALDGLFLSLK